ncbi:putative Calcium/calmodulin-dependent protein kinase kinase [Blattamonas nauphoetae]|uniref:Calcium/calmodulin-dependent protein kinase kinase n=1 Tax=Blattamonas nauphoetae TaxID=2049346 RepID=A0ABQ9X8A3_9EUKA|nr:putative Calcium/calmodulin-dependent protein kinase kinase [Blattamonas nauphoetae]
MISSLSSNTSVTSRPPSQPSSPRATPTLNVVHTEQFEKQKDEKTGNKIINQYVIVKTIGQGAYGKVKLLHYAANPEEMFAMKVIKKSQKGRKGKKTAAIDPGTAREIAIMKKIVHPNLVRLYEVIDNPGRNKLYMVMEFIDGGAVFKDGDPPLDNDTARVRFKQIVTGIAYLHMQHIVHHDIKPDNILIMQDGSCKISDFGVSMYYETMDTKINGIRGTPAFIPPEACCIPAQPGGYNPFAADIWSLGVLLFYFMFGQPPYLEETVPLTYRRIVEDPIPFDRFEERTKAINPDCLGLIEKLMEKDPVDRIMMDELIVDSWLTNYGEDPIDLVADMIVVTEADIEKAITPLIKWTTLVSLQMMVRRRALRARANIASRKRSAGAPEVEATDDEQPKQIVHSVSEGSFGPTRAKDDASSVRPQSSAASSDHLDRAQSLTQFPLAHSQSTATIDTITTDDKASLAENPVMMTYVDQPRVFDADEYLDLTEVEEDVVDPASIGKTVQENERVKEEMERKVDETLTDLLSTNEISPGIDPPVQEHLTDVSSPSLSNQPTQLLSPEGTPKHSSSPPSMVIQSVRLHQQRISQNFEKMQQKQQHLISRKQPHSIPISYEKQRQYLPLSSSVPGAVSSNSPPHRPSQPIRTISSDQLLPKLRSASPTSLPSISDHTSQSYSVPNNHLRASFDSSSSYGGKLRTPLYPTFVSKPNRTLSASLNVIAKSKVKSEMTTKTPPSEPLTHYSTLSPFTRPSVLNTITPPISSDKQKTAKRKRSQFTQSTHVPYTTHKQGGTGNRFPLPLLGEHKDGQIEIHDTSLTTLLLTQFTVLSNDSSTELTVSAADPVWEVSIEETPTQETRGKSRRVRANTQTLAQLQQEHPDLPHYYAFILTSPQVPDMSSRQFAGTQLRNLFKRESQWSFEDKQSIFYSILPGLKDQRKEIRNSVSACIAAFIVSVGFENSFSFLDQLINNCKSSDETEAIGSCKCLLTIVEDSQQHFSAPQLSQQLTHLVSRIIELINPQRVDPCVSALKTLQIFFAEQPFLFTESLQLYLKNIFQCINHQSVLLQRESLKCLTDISSLQVDNHPIIPFASDMVQHVLGTMNSNDEDLVLRSIDFWGIVSENRQVSQQAFLPRIEAISQALLSKLLYSDADLERYREEMDDGQDKPDTDLDDDDDEDEDDFLNEQEEGQDTNRKAASRSLHSLSAQFPNEVTASLVPLLSQLFAATDENSWQNRESGIFALGLLSTSCQAALHPNLPYILPWVVNFCTDQQYLIRQISCWVLSRYYVWICGPLDQRDIKRGYVEQSEINLPRAPDYTILEQTLYALTTCLGDPMRLVRKRACEALTSLVEEARSRIIAYAKEFLDQILIMLEKYDPSQKRYLLDLLTALVTASGGLFNETAILEKAMRPVLNMLDVTPIQDEVLLPSLLRSVQSVAAELQQDSFKPYILPIVSKCVVIVAGEDQRVRAEIQQSQAELQQYGTPDTTDLDDDIGHHENRAVSEALETLATIIKYTNSALQNEIFQQTNFLPFTLSILSSPSQYILLGCFEFLSELIRTNIQLFTGPHLPENQTLLSVSFPLLIQYSVPQHLKRADPTTNTITISFANSDSNHADMEFRLSINALRAIAETIDALGNQMEGVLASFLQPITPLLFLAAPNVLNAPILYNPRHKETRMNGTLVASATANCLARLCVHFPVQVCQTLAENQVIPHFLTCLIMSATEYTTTLNEMKGLVSLVQAGGDCLNALITFPSLLIEALASFVSDPDSCTLATNQTYRLNDDMKQLLGTALTTLKQGFGQNWMGNLQSLNDTAKHNLQNVYHLI